MMAEGSLLRCATDDAGQGGSWVGTRERGVRVVVQRMYFFCYSALHRCLSFLRDDFLLTS